MKRYLTEADFREVSNEGLEMAKAWAEGDEFQAYMIATLIKAEAYKAEDGTDERFLLEDLYKRLDSIGRSIAKKLCTSEKNFDRILDMLERYALDFQYLALAHGGKELAEKLAEHFKSVRYTATNGGEHHFGTELSFLSNAEALEKLAALYYQRRDEDEEE